MSAVTALVEEARSLGAVLELHGGNVKVKAPAPLPTDLMEALRQHKAEVMALLQRQGVEPRYVPPAREAFDLPFPLGYGGLPENEVVAAEGWNDVKGVEDPCARRLNVYMWIMSGMAWHGETGELYQRVKDEYHRLRHGAYPEEKDCGYCDAERQDRKRRPQYGAAP